MTTPPASRQGRNKRQRRGSSSAAQLRNRILLYAGILAAVLVIGFPFYWIIIQSLEPAADFSQGTHSLLPQHLTTQNYRDVIGQDHFLRPILNSVLVATIVTAITLVVGTLAGYALARIKLPARALILGYVLAAGFFPLTAVIGPLFLLYRRSHLLDSYTGLALAYLIYTLPIAVWTLTNFFRQIPLELEEAATMDGAGRLRVLTSVVLPVSRPALFTVAILSFILAWNDFTFALSFLQTPDKFTAPLAIVNLGQSKYQFFYNKTDAAVVLVTLPIIALVLAAQRRLVSGITTGAVK